MRIAYLASAVTMPGSPTRRGDGFEHDYMMQQLRRAFEARGASIQDIAWDDPSAEWASFDAAVIGTTWDYWDRVDEFLATLARITECTSLHNPLPLVRWNIHKTYLRDLEKKGACLIPTLWLDRPDEMAAHEAFETLRSEDLVFKRQIGAGAFGQHRIKRGDRIPAMVNPMMVQPYVPSIETEGEYSFVFIGGVLSHALIKRAAPGDYRIQSLYGGKEARIEPSAADIAAARDILGTLDSVPLYARVDMVRGADGRLLLMELELIEPYLYPQQGADLGALFADALIRRL